MTDRHLAAILCARAMHPAKAEQMTLAELVTKFNEYVPGSQEHWLNIARDYMRASESISFTESIRSKIK